MRERPSGSCHGLRDVHLREAERRNRERMQGVGPRRRRELKRPSERRDIDEEEAERADGDERAREHPPTERNESE
jgi:hypothetical protein